MNATAAEFTRSKIETQTRADPRVRSVSDERRQGDGVWLYLIHGYCCEVFNHGGCSDDCVHVVHERSWSECARVLRDEVRECVCADCAN